LEREKRIASLLETIGCPGMADIKVLTGIPFIEIIKQVLRGNHDLLIKPAEIPGNRITSLGSTDMHLLRKCQIPIWIVKPTHRKKYRRIMAAIDPDPMEQNAKLNTLILELATSLAEREIAELHAVTAWSLDYELELRSRARQIKTNQLIEDLQKTYKIWLKQVTDPYVRRGDLFHVHLINGKVGEAIPAEARKRHIDIIVMGTIGRTGIPGFFIGNTAEQILARVNCSVLAVKPEGFESPVKA
jgi:universal stress protein E